MPRAYPTPQQDYGQDSQGGDWQALRGELVALLDQVESQVARTRREDEGYQGISERMRELRYQVSDEPENRHREALRSVKRAVDRFSDRDESYPAREEPLAPNPRDTLQSAIRQIRDRHRESVPHQRAMEAERYVVPPRFADQTRQPEPQPRYAPAVARQDSLRFDELAHAVGGVSGRLERLESELRSAAKVQTGNVKEIAEQVAQLSHVVELLAGAVGETGQVKRLEAQIAGVAKLVAQGPQVDLSALTKRLDDLGATVGKLIDRQQKDGTGVAQRLDDVSSTMGRLADLQVQFANRVDGTAQATAGLADGLNGIDDGVTGLRDGMKAVEEGVRNIYDRIDSIEKHTALSPGDVDKLTEEMARFTEAMKNPVQPQGLIELVDELNARIANIESSHRDIGGLKADAEALRIAVIEAVEPRFAALEMQIEALSDRVGEQRPGADISVGQLEAQVRQLVARMDQTGEQLTGLARLYQPAEREPAPDFEALADLVAARTSEAVAQSTAPMPVPSGLDDAGIDEIEKRVSRLFKAATGERTSDDLSGIDASIREVNERLGRLEASLTARAQEAERLAAVPVEPMMPPAPVAPAAEPVAAMPGPAPMSAAAVEAPAVVDEPVNDPIAPLLAEAAESAMFEARTDTPPRSDAMPANPSMDAPLTDRPFGDLGPVKAALEAKNGPRKHHPGLSYDEPEAPPAPGSFEPPAPPPLRAPGAPAASLARPDFDPDTVERPPRPMSSFDSPERAGFADAKPAPAAMEEPAPAPAAEPAAEPTPSTNTFIAAARRAAQRGTGTTTKSSGGGAGSLIARALQSFQPTTKPAEGDTEKPAKAAKPKKEKKGRVLAGDKASPTEWKPDDEMPATSRAGVASSTLPPAPSSSLAGPKAPEPIALDHEAPETPLGEERESFLSRHRRPILLAASLVAIAFLTLNLINQRMGGSDPSAPAPEPATDTSSLEADVTSPLANEPMAAAMPAAASTPRVVPIVDSLATASIDPAMTAGFTPAGELPQMPTAFTAPAAATAATPAATAAGEMAVAALTGAPASAEPAPIESPVKLDLPPANVGPEPLRLAAAHGDPRAQFEIAAIYTEGRAVAEDLEQAAIWYERSAAQGFAPAQYRLGNLYENGRGVTADINQAKLWYLRAAEAGNRMAMHNLAALYAGGQLGAQEFDSAAEWFEQAALRGMRDSQFNLGMLFARGLGVTQSLEESYRWFALAAKRGDTDAAKARDDVARSLDAETVGRLNDEIAAFQPAVIDLGANFAPIGTWSESFDPGETIGNVEVVRSVQMALTALGYDVGTPDGLAGPRTAEAIRTFERATGMSESGAVNPRLLAVLGSQPV
jgi:localization factor PodJL